MDPDDLTFVFGDRDRDRAAGFELGAATLDDAGAVFGFAATLVFVDGGVRHEVVSGNGVEGAGLAVWRTDLRRLLHHRRGGVSLTDHDGTLRVVLWFEGDEVLAFASVPSPERWTPPFGETWDHPIGPTSLAHLEALVGRIDAIEAATGPFTGFCCGTPPETWPAWDPRG